MFVEPVKQFKRRSAAISISIILFLISICIILAMLFGKEVRDKNCIDAGFDYSRYDNGEFYCAEYSEELYPYEREVIE